ELTTRMLQKRGYKVLAAGTPGEALRIAMRYSGVIHLLMSDVVMPGMNGHDLAANLLSHNPRLKGLFMSGYATDAVSHQRGLDRGGHFIPKPFSAQALASKIREVLKHPSHLH
ncbi:MAG: response regulator, partial [Syntrophales bacterium LBB04]|nr:response regulator [Syntrophales bacterium LBB04]